MQLIVGVKGTGKTKALIEEVNKASTVSNGTVICIEYGRKLTFDIAHRVRLVDAKEYGVNDSEKLFGFVCGMLAGNYDITDIFIDSALKICNDDAKAFEEFFLNVAKITKEHNIECVITASADPEIFSPEVKQYIRNGN